MTFLKTESSNFNDFLPREMAIKAKEIGIKKAELGWVKVFVLSLLAGAFIGLGAIFATTATAGGSSLLPYGIVKLLGGLVFCLGLILVVVGGAELFTGNNLIVIAWAERSVSTMQLMKNWIIVYIGNFIGSLLVAGINFYTRSYNFGGSIIGKNILDIANLKCNLDFMQALTLGIMCNFLVCLAVWLCYSCRTTTGKILSIIFPISGFVAAGYEHCVANMYFVPVALFVKGNVTSVFWDAIGKNADCYSQLTWGSFFVNNLIPVTLGNIIGGSIFVGLTYWFVFLKESK